MLTVVTPSLTFDLTVLATVKEEMGITVSTYDTRLARLIHEASYDCARYCNRVFAEETVSETLRDVSGVESITLERYPVSSITSVIVDGGTPLVAGTDYVVDGETGILKRLSGGSYTTWGGTTIVILYVGGYELLADLPPDIERACIEQVKDLYYGGPRDPRLRSVDVPGVQSETYWVGGTGEDDAVCPAAADRLAAHRKPARMG